jgi:hypothetical protein
MRLRDGNSPEARKFARDILLDGKPTNFGKCFSKLLDHHFFWFAKKIRISSTIGNLLEMLIFSISSSTAATVCSNSHES